LRNIKFSNVDFDSLDYDLAYAVKASSDGIAINNIRREFIYVSDALVKIYGYDSPDELIGKSWKILYDDNEVKRFDKIIMPEFKRILKVDSEVYWFCGGGGGQPNKVRMVKYKGQLVPLSSLPPELQARVPR
jgi:PAS domain-containing protein